MAEFKAARTKLIQDDSAEAKAREAITSNVRNLQMFSNYVLSASTKELLEYRRDIVESMRNAADMIDMLFEKYVHEYELAETLEAERNALDNMLRESGWTIKPEQ